MHRRPAIFRLVALLLLAVVALPSGVVAAPGDASPVASCSDSPATPSLVGDERIELVVQVRPRDEITPIAKTVNSAWAVISGRLACFAPEATVVVRRPDRIIVSVSAERDIADLTTLITRADLLEIIDPRGRTLSVGTVVTTSLGGPEDVLAPSDYAGEEIDDSGYETIVSGADLEDAYVTNDQFDNPVVAFDLTEDGAARLYEFTSASDGQPMAIVINKRVISAPVIEGTISDAGVISGLDADEVDDLVGQLNLAISLAQLELVSVDGTPVAGGA